MPGHGDTGGAELLVDVADHLLLRDETWARRDSTMSRDTIVEEISALMVARHPEWVGQKWIDKGVVCLCA